jgi:hypothetical protein
VSLLISRRWKASDYYGRDLFASAVVWNFEIFPHLKSLETISAAPMPNSPPKQTDREYPCKMVTTKTWDMIWFVAGAALGIVTSHGQARAQAPGCVVMEVAVEDQEAFTQRSPPVVDKLGKENEPRGLGQQEATVPLVGVPLPRPRGKQRGTTDKDDDIAAREKAFASGQSLVDYCNLKIESDTKR